jgi:phosphohistidine phosphatase SixA
MDLYLMQHGQATTETEDPERPLTDAGRAAVQRVAERARAADVRISGCLHSGKLRAEQTAQLLVREIGVEPSVEARPGLAPNDPVVPVAQWLRAETEHQSLALVGHAGPRSPRGSPPHLIVGAAGPGLGVPAHVPDLMDGGVHPDICWSHLARDGQHVPRSGDMSSHYGGGVLILRPPGTQLDDQQAEHRCRSRSPRPASTAQPGERRQRERTEHRNRAQPPGALPPPRGQPQARPVPHPSMIRREPRPRRCFHHLVRLGIRRGLAPVGGPH